MTTSAQVPGRFPVAINGRPYMTEGMERQSLQVLRQQSDVSALPSEASLNPRGLWRRSQESYHHGAGQLFRDGEDADPARFRASKGVDPWTEGKLTLLNETVRLRESANTNLKVLALQYATVNRLAVIDGNEVYISEEPINLLSDNQENLEVGTTGWAAGANTTIARDTVQFYNGVASLRLTATGAGTMSATTPTGTSGIPVAPLRLHTFAFRKRIASGTTTATITPTIHWYNSAGALISSFTQPGQPITNAWTSYTDANPVSPAGAAYAAVALVVAGAGVGEQVFFDVIQLVRGDYWTAAGATWYPVTVQAGQAAQTPQSFTTNGTHIWTALGTSGLHRTTNLTTTADVPAAPASGNISLVGYANGRLLAAGSNSAGGATAKNILWEVLDPLGSPALADGTTGLRFIHANTSFEFTFIAPGRNCIYAGGNAGGNAEIYRIGINPTDTSLTAPIFATYLPDGETIHALQFYAGGVIMGTSKGIRTATVDGQGNLDYGPLIETPAPVLCLEPQGRFCWFGMSNYDDTSTGLGRLDLGFFTETLVPAWASDLMTTGQGAVTGAATFQRNMVDGEISTSEPEQRVFAVSGLGFFGEDIMKVASGTLETGGIRYGTTERKTMRSVDFRHHVLDGTVSVEMMVDEGAYATLGSSSVQGSAGPAAPIDAGDVPGETVELRYTLARPTDGRIVNVITTDGSALLDDGGVDQFTAADVGRSITDVRVAIDINHLQDDTRIASVDANNDATMTKAATVTGGAKLIVSSPLRAPDLVRWTLHALPTPQRNQAFVLPLILRTYVEDLLGTRTPVDVPAELDALMALEEAGSIIEFQVGEDTHEGYVEMTRHQGTQWTLAGANHRYVEGIYEVTLVTV